MCAERFRTTSAASISPLFLSLVVLETVIQLEGISSSRHTV